MRIEALASVAHGHYLARHNRQAEEAYARLWEMLEKTGLERTGMAATVLNNWSLVHYQGDIARAEVLCRRAVELRRSIESPESVVPTATFNHAGALLRLGRYDEAQRLFEETIATAGARDEPRIRFDAMMELADLHIEKGDLARAAGQLAKLDTVRNTPSFDPWRQQQLAYYEARLALARGDYPEARARFAGVAERFEKRKSKITMNVMALIGLARLAQGDLSGRTGRLTGRGPRTAARWTTFSAPSARTTPLPSPAGSTPRSAVRRPAGSPPAPAGFVGRCVVSCPPLPLSPIDGRVRPAQRCSAPLAARW